MAGDRVQRSLLVGQLAAVAHIDAALLAREAAAGRQGHGQVTENQLRALVGSPLLVGGHHAVHRQIDLGAFKVRRARVDQAVVQPGLVGLAREGQRVDLALGFLVQLLEVGKLAQDGVGVYFDLGRQRRLDHQQAGVFLGLGRADGVLQWLVVGIQARGHRRIHATFGVVLDDNLVGRHREAELDLAALNVQLGHTHEVGHLG